MIMTCAEVSGLHLRESPISEDWQDFALLGGLGIFFLGILMKPFQAARYHSHEARYFLYLIPTVLISEVMLNVSVALWIHYLGGASEPPIEDPSMGASLLVGLPLFLIFFASPRFTFMSKNFTWLTLTSGLGLAIYEFWGLMRDYPLI